MSGATATTNLASRAARGTALSLLGQLGTHGLRLASNLLLTQLLAPEAFGLILVVTTVTVGLQMATDLGLGQAVVQSRRQDRAFLDTAWTLGLLRGLLLFALACAAAHPGAWLYERPEVVWLLPLCAVQLILLGLESTRTAELQRQLAPGRVIAVELVSQVLALAAAVPVALATRSVLALAVAALVAVAVRTAASHLVYPGARNRLRLEREAVRELFVFGRGIALAATIFFLGTRWDVFALGKLEGMELVGVYGLAQLVLSVPVQMIERSMDVVLLPALAERFRQAPERVAADLEAARRLVLPASAALLLACAAVAPAFFSWLYRDAWGDAAWLAQLAAAAAWFGTLHELGRRALVAAGATRPLVAANLVRLGVTVVATGAGFLGFGVVGFVAGNAVGAAAGAVAAAWLLRPLGARTVARDLWASAGFLVLLGACCGAPWWLAPRLDVGVPALGLALGLAGAGPVAWVALQRARAATAART